jgi:hypothetical protein
VQATFFLICPPERESRERVLSGCAVQSRSNEINFRAISMTFFRVPVPLRHNRIQRHDGTSLYTLQNRTTRSGTVARMNVAKPAQE